jgi:hypothetical protein
MSVREQHAATALALGAGQHGVVTRRALVRAGVPRWFLRNELQQRRWRVLGRQCIVLHSGLLSPAAQRWGAVLEVGKRAVLDGVTALQVAGLKGITEQDIHVSTPRGSTP